MAMRERSALAALLAVALVLCRTPLPWILGGCAVLALLAWRPRPAAPPPDEGYLPFVTVVIPARDEEAVIAGAIEAALGQEYGGDCEVLVVDDGSRDGTARVVRAWAHRHPRLRLLRRPAGGESGKGAALAAAMPLCRGELVALLDADAWVAADFLERLVPLLAPVTVGAVQARKLVRGPARGLLPRLQADEAVLVAGLQRARAAQDGAVDLMGNGMVIKRHALADVGGWSPVALTEDLDLGTRLHARNWEVRYAHGAVVWEGPVPGWAGLYRQRLRWAEGSYRRFCRHFWAMLWPNVPWGKRADMCCYLGGLLLPLGLGGAMLLRAAGVAMGLRWLGLVALLALLLTPLQVGRALHRDGERRPTALLARSCLVTLFLAAVWTPTVLAALARIVLRERPSAWQKTEHREEAPAGWAMGGMAAEAPPCR